MTLMLEWGHQIMQIDLYSLMALALFWFSADCTTYEMVTLQWFPCMGDEPNQHAAKNIESN